MDKRQIQRKRMMLYFIEAADQIIEEEGITEITARKVADKAGYNSATLYNYFENLEHLVFFAAMKNIRDYTAALPESIAKSDNAIDIFLNIWECFCLFSYKKPDIYYAIFFANLDDNLQIYINQYYELFPEDLFVLPENMSTIFLKQDIYERGRTTIERCVGEGLINREDAEDLNEIGNIIYQGMLLKLIKNKINSQEALEKTMKYIKIFVESIRIN